jgi:hypothetical protein
VASETPFAALAMIAATALGWDIDGVLIQTEAHVAGFERDDGFVMQVSKQGKKTVQSWANSTAPDNRCGAGARVSIVARSRTRRRQGESRPGRR